MKNVSYPHLISYLFIFFISTPCSCSSSSYLPIVSFTPSPLPLLFFTKYPYSFSSALLTFLFVYPSSYPVSSFSFLPVFSRYLFSIPSTCLLSLSLFHLIFLSSIFVFSIPSQITSFSLPAPHFISSFYFFSLHRRVHCLPSIIIVHKVIKRRYYYKPFLITYFSGENQQYDFFARGVYL